MASIDNNFAFAEASFPSFLDDDLAVIAGMKKRVEGIACESGTVVGSSDGTASAAEREDGLSGSFGGFGCGGRPTAAVGGLGERVAARAGFSAPRLNTARVRLGDGALVSPRGARSPCLTIPPGLSPTTLLDSPVFLFNSQAQPSPTTGAFPFPSLSQINDSTISDTTRVPAAASKEQTCERYSDSTFAFKPHVGGVSCFRSSGDQASFSIQEPSWSRVENAFQLKSFVEAKNTATAHLVSETHAEGQHQDESYNKADSLTISSGEGNIKNTTADTQASVGIMCSEQSPITENQLDDNEDKDSSFAPAAVGVSSDDGYNWRKYGQKQVKSSEYPRSYYKCTHTNCQVRKKIERAHDGRITEIIYKGAHNHPKPPPSRRSLAALPVIEDAAFEHQDQGLHETAESQPVWRGNQLETSAGSQDWKADSSEMTSLAPSADFCDQSVSAQSRSFGHHEVTDAPEISSTLSGGNDDDEMATNFSMSLGDEGEVDELESKRRKKDDGCAVDAAMTSRGIREPRVVVQTTSEVDILDDGYRWRKYGQKVVKGNPNPRSYYKCTSPGCPVRKHVERASHDLKSVITTYEGKHNHDVPAARSSTGGNHFASTTSNMGTAPASSSHILKPEPVPPQNNIMRISNLHEQLSISSLPGIGPANTPQMGQSLYSGISSFPLNQQMGLGNFKFSGLPSGHEHGSYLMQQKLAEVAPPSRLPGELKEEPVFESGVPGTHGSLYHQIMGTLPLGPQL